MQVTLYKMTSDPRKIGKSYSGVATLEGSLVNESGVIDPVLLVEAGAFITGCNYAWVDAFARFYFIREMVSVRNGIWRLSLHVDVLETYKTAILATNALIDRSQSENPYMADSRYTLDSDNDFEVVGFPSGLNKNLKFVLTVSGG